MARLEENSTQIREVGKKQASALLQQFTMMGICRIWGPRVVCYSHHWCFLICTSGKSSMKPSYKGGTFRRFIVQYNSQTKL